MEVPIHLQYIILHTGIMYCMNLCHSQVVWKDYLGLSSLWEFRFFVGAPVEGIPPGCSYLVGQICHIDGCLVKPKVPEIEEPVLDCATFEDDVLLCPDVFLCIQMSLYCTNILHIMCLASNVWQM